MSINKTPRGSKGAKVDFMLRMTKPLRKVMIKQHRRSGNKFNGMDVLYLSTVGAKSGQRREVPVAYFPDDDGWLIVASAGGSASNPAWYHNIAAHPDQVSVEVDGKRHRVVPEQLEGNRREEAWKRIATSQSRFAGYQEKTDRLLPVIRLAPKDE